MKVGKKELKLLEKFLVFRGKYFIICFYYYNDNLICFLWLFIN